MLSRCPHKGKAIRTKNPVLSARLLVVIFGIILLIPFHDVKAQVAGGPCPQNKVGTTGLPANQQQHATTVLACLADQDHPGQYIWKPTFNVPTCPPVGQPTNYVLHYNGINFVCDPLAISNFPACPAGDAVTYNGTSFSCVVVTPTVTGSCGGTQFTCATGSLANSSDNGTTSTWNCNGSGQGSNAACSLADNNNNNNSNTCNGTVDACGVCNGNGSTCQCTGGLVAVSCNGSDEIDEISVCNGPNNTQTFQNIDAGNTAYCSSCASTNTCPDNCTGNTCSSDGFDTQQGFTP